MALSGFTTSNYMWTDSPVVNSSPYSMHCQFYDTLGNATLKALATFTRANSTTLYAGLLVSNGTARFATNSASSNAVSGAYSTNTWNRLGGVHVSNTSRSVFLNGTKTTSSGNTGGVANVPYLGVGIRSNNGGGVNSPALGITIAELGVWDVVLTDEEFAALNSGVSPLSIRVQSLKHYIPLIRDPIDAMCPAPTVVGSLTVEPHCRTFL